MTVDGSVTWVNHDDDEHTVTATDGSFHAVLDPGEEFTFSEPGTYSYLCSYHDDMTGTVTVTTTAPVTR